MTILYVFQLEIYNAIIFVRIFLLNRLHSYRCLYVGQVHDTQTAP